MLSETPHSHAKETTQQPENLNYFLTLHPELQDELRRNADLARHAFEGAHSIGVDFTHQEAHVDEQELSDKMHAESRSFALLDELFEAHPELKPFTSSFEHHSAQPL